MTTVNTNYSAAQTAAAAASTAPAIGEEFNTFIKLLTAQVRNQDPLAPLDSTQFVEQLATFSSLEQQVQSNSALGTIATMMSDMTGLLAGQWLGQTVSVEATNVPFAGESIDFTVKEPSGTDHSVLTIKDSAGQVVWTETLDPSTDMHAWDGMTLSGEAATTGAVYSYSIDSYKADNTLISSQPPRVITSVTSISSEDGVLYVNTAAQLVSELGKVKKI